MIVPYLKDGALLQELREADPGDSHFQLWWLGQSGFLLKWQGRFLLFDPYLSDSLTEKYAGSVMPHVRMTERCLDPAELGFVDLVTSSHPHTDHLDAATLLPMAARHAGPMPLVLPSSSLALASGRLAAGEFAFHGMDAGDSIELSGFRITALPSAHDTVERDDAGRCRFLGYVVEAGPWALYHSGDTRWFPELPALLQLHRPDVVMLPINGYDPARGVAGNLDGIEAAELASVCGARLVIPHHFDLFEFNTASPAVFEEACHQRDQPFLTLRCGEAFCSRNMPAGKSNLV